MGGQGGLVGRGIVGGRKAGWLSLEVGETRRGGRVGLAGGREVSSPSLYLASSLSGDAVREMWREEVQTLSCLLPQKKGFDALTSRNLSKT